MKYENGDVYLGNFKNGKKDGKGIMIYTNGEIFEGYWKNDNKKELVSKYSNSQIIKYYEQFKSEKFDHNNLDNAKLNNNDLDDFIKKIDLNTQYCQLHKNLIIGLCIDKDCKEKNKLICQKCIFREHKKHDITEIQENNDKFRENVIKGEKLILEMNDINENKKFSDKKLELKISELKLYVNELIKKKVESFIYPVFDKITKKNENFFNQTILKIKNNYPIDNLDKQVEIKNLILLFENMNIDIKDKIELINDILSIKFKNIENEIKKIFSVIFDNKDSSIFEIENYWTKEIYKSDSNEFGYELDENKCLAKKVSWNKHLIKSKLKLKEGNKYIFIFNITYKYDFYEIGFISNESLQLKESEDERELFFYQMKVYSLME